MRFIRQIVLGLAVAAVFVYLSVFSMIEYRSGSVDFNAQKDRLPIATAVLSVLSQFMSAAEKIPLLNFLPATQVGGDYDVKVAKETLDKYAQDAENKSNITEELPTNLSLDLLNQATSSVESVNFSELFDRLKASLSKDWFRP
jgi:hypothetical protein